MSSIASGPWTAAPAAARRLWRVKSIGQTEKQAVPSPDESLRLPTANLLAGLHGYGLSLAYLIKAAPDGVSISIGSWQSPNSPVVVPMTLDKHAEALRSSLAAVYPTIEIEPAITTLVRPEIAGLAIGIPNLGKPDRVEQTVPIDRLLRALHGTAWSVLILATPVMADKVRPLRHDTLNEHRAALDFEKTEGPSAIASHYSELLKASTNLLTQGLSLGVWRTAVYLMSDSVGYFRLEGVWRSIFAGEESVLAPLLTMQNEEIAKLAVQWSMPDTAGAPGPGAFRHRYEYQTLLTSHQLATYIHFPEKETSGFAIQTIPSFDVVPQAREEGQRVVEELVVRLPPKGMINLGEIAIRGYATQTDYNISLDSLAEHAFVSGVTGSGKTTTIFHLLKEVDRLGKSFLVVEPAKTEYRGLLNDEVLSKKLQIFTLGNENVSPFRLNPFEKSPKTPISVHLELLRSVFAASFGMWQPLPQVLESCIHAVYRDSGWDLAQNSNSRLDENSPMALAFPTLTDLVSKVEEITPTLGYDQKIASDIRAALVTRINSLRVGGKGRMLDTQYSIPIEFVLDTPTVLELEDMGDDDDKAFMMGLILIRVVEHLRDQGRSDTLKYLFVLEEAHRLLTNIAPSGNPEQASPRAKAIESFTNMLAEVRAYGLGMVIADQIPVKLVPDVIKNTNLKIAHRIVAEDDRAVLAGATNMNPQQMRALSLLQPTKGEAAVFSRGDDAPIMVRMKNAKPAGAWPDARSIIALRRERELTRSTRNILNPNSEYIEAESPQSEPARKVSRIALESPEIRQSFSTLVTSIAEDIRMLGPLWDASVKRLQRLRPRGVDETWLHRWIAIEISRWFAKMRGRQNEWTYSEQQQVEDLLRAALLAKATGVNSDRYAADFHDYWRHLHARSFDPLPACSSICDDQPHVCLYRQAVVESLTSTARSEFEDSYLTDTKAGAELPQTWQHCASTALKLVTLQPAMQPATRRAALCYAQHQLLGNSDEVRERILNRLSQGAKGAVGNG
jgi:hypothetical protein